MGSAALGGDAENSDGEGQAVQRREGTGYRSAARTACARPPQGLHRHRRRLRNPHPGAQGLVCGAGRTRRDHPRLEGGWPSHLRHRLGLAPRRAAAGHAACRGAGQHRALAESALGEKASGCARPGGGALGAPSFARRPPRRRRRRCGARRRDLRSGRFERVRVEDRVAVALFSEKALAVLREVLVDGVARDEGVEVRGQPALLRA